MCSGDFYLKRKFMTEIVPETLNAEPDQTGIAEVAPPVVEVSRARKAVGNLMLAASLSALGYQQMPTNEAVRTAITLEAYENTDDKITAGVAAGVATMATEGGTSTLIAFGLASENSAASKLIERYRRRKAAKKALDDTELETEITENATDSTSIKRKVGRGLGNSAIALTLGPGIVVLKKHITGENSTVRQAVRTGIGYSLFGSVVSAGVFGYGVTEGKTGLEDIAADTVFEAPVDAVTDPKTWVAGVALTGLVVGVSKLRNRSKTNDMEFAVEVDV